MTTTTINEPTMIGLSERTHPLLKRLKEDGHFAEMADAYRFGIALALAHGVEPEEPSPRITIFSVATIDPDREIAVAIKALTNPQGVSIYKQVERYAEWGVKELAKRAEDGDIDFASILKEAEKLAREAA
jgi:hypothetical protein